MPYLQRLGIWSPLLFIGIYAVCMVIGFPTVIFTIAGGVVFGLLWGTVYSIAGATLGAMGALWLTRYLFRDWVEHRFGHNPTLQKFQRGIAEQSLLFVLSMRLIPVTPFNVENYLFGLTLVDWRSYLLGTIVGIIPGTIAYTWVGVTGAQALEGGSALSFFLAVGLLLFISVSPILISHWHRRRTVKR
ncbi:TVP38/TMEM64 family protein [Leptolyngbya sp. FACHB-16]|nr:TVP38/TMEM64 family protein [Leptolyngbya sp. FACHB-8]MBD2158983.1 TVP38/TMEM64 family protein [Leptolyngbya sp. FACHB-16]